MACEVTERDRIESAHDVYLGFDVGKSFHWACALVGGEAKVDRVVMNARDDVRAAISEAQALAGDGGVLVTVDQMYMSTEICATFRLKSGTDFS